MMNFFKKKPTAAEIENQKFDIQVKTGMSIKSLDKELAKYNKKAQEAFTNAQNYRAAGNKDAAIDAYEDYKFARNMGKIVKKNVRMMEQISTMVKVGNLSNDIFGLLSEALELSNFEPQKLNDVLRGNEKMKGLMDMLDDSLPDNEMEGGITAEEWYESGKESMVAGADPHVTESNENMKAALNEMKG